MLKVETDPASGFCGGVIRAISQAEACLERDGKLYSLGAIVHNEAELERLRKMGLVTVDSLDEVPSGSQVLIRAHGEPPSTYELARQRKLLLTDCTCPVVLQLQSRIRDAHSRVKALGGSLVIFGRVGHAEVLGLLGQVGGDALVVENEKMLSEAILEGRIPSDKPAEIFSQTTKSPEEYERVCSLLRSHVASLTVHDSICAQVAGRHRRLSEFAASHDVIVFVAGRSSSNGKVLSDLCRRVNPRTHICEGPSDVDASWFPDGASVGVCGATSTPKWLLENVAQAIRNL